MHINLTITHMHGLILHHDQAFSHFLQQATKMYDMTLDCARSSHHTLSLLHDFQYDFCLISKEELVSHGTVFIENMCNAFPHIKCIVITNESNQLEVDQMVSMGASLVLFEHEPIFDMCKKIIFLTKEYALIHYKDLTLDTRKRRVMRSTMHIPLRNLEFNLLLHLLNNQGFVLTRESILSNVWDHQAECFTNTVDVHIHRLRKKLNSHGHPNIIHTVPCVGYTITSLESRPQCV